MVETYKQTLDRICVLYKQIKYNKRQSLPLGAHLTEKRQEKVFLTLTLFPTVGGYRTPLSQFFKML